MCVTELSQPIGKDYVEIMKRKKKKKNKRSSSKHLIVLLAVLIVALVLPVVYAEQVNKDININIQCSNSTYANITAILSKTDSSYILKGEYGMTKLGTNYNYTLNSTLNNKIGNLEINYHCDINGVDTSAGYIIEVTPTGYEGSLLGFYILILIIPWVLFLFGLWKRELSIAVLATFIFYLVALFIIPFGIDGIKNNITYAIGFVYLGFAIFTSIKYAHEMLT